MISKLVGIPEADLDTEAFSYMRYLYSDGSFIVLVFDNCSDRFVSITARPPDSFYLGS